MGKLRIAVWHNLPSGGGKRQLYNHVKGLVERGHHVESWCPDSADQKFLPLSTLVKETIIPLKGRSDDFSNPLRPYRATREMIRAMEEQCRACAAEINRGDFDLLYANSCMYLRTTPIAKFVGLPSAIYLGEPYRWFYEAMPELPWIAPLQYLDQGISFRHLKDFLRKQVTLNSIRLQARAEVEYAKGFDLILANSTYSRESILRTYHLDSKVCYLGVDTDHYRPTGEKREDFIVGLGTIYHGKGVDRAINAVGAIAPKKRPQLVWVGNGASEWDLCHYRELAQGLGVDFVPRIHISDQEVISLLSRARAMIYTSRLEPFGLAPLEANACCTPVIGIAEGGVKETIRDGVNGYLALNDDPGEIAGLIMKILDNPREAERMGKEARKYVETHWPYDFGTDNIEKALRGLHEKKGTAKVLQGKTLHKLEPTNDIKMHVEHKEFQAGHFRIKGWGFIDDGKGAKGASMFLTIHDKERSRMVPMKHMKRRDVTRHFKEAADFDDSGFTLACTVHEEAPQFGIVIVRDSKVSFRRL